MEFKIGGKSWETLVKNVVMNIPRTCHTSFWERIAYTFSLDQDGAKGICAHFNVDEDTGHKKGEQSK